MIQLMIPPHKSAYHSGDEWAKPEPREKDESDKHIGPPGTLRRNDRAKVCENERIAFEQFVAELRPHRFFCPNIRHNNKKRL